MPQPVTFPSIASNFLTFFGLSGASTFSSLARFAADAWLVIVIVGYILSFGGLVAIVYILMRIYELRKREEEFYETLIPAPGSAAQVAPRWERIRALAGGASPSEWREAIIEADIMLDDALTRRGYAGDVGEKLRQAAGTLATLRNAQEAHGVRNRVAHEGSAFDLSPTLLARTLAQYESALRELGAL